MPHENIILWSTRSQNKLLRMVQEVCGIYNCYRSVSVAFLKFHCYSPNGALIEHIILIHNCPNKGWRNVCLVSYDSRIKFYKYPSRQSQNTHFVLNWSLGPPPPRLGRLTVFMRRFYSRETAGPSAIICFWKLKQTLNTVLYHHGTLMFTLNMWYHYSCMTTCVTIFKRLCSEAI